MRIQLSYKLLGILFISILIFTYGLLMLSHPSTEYDEGIYLTTFLLANKGFPLYSHTFFSQFPGFFALTNPIFLLGNESLQAGRFAVFLWSFFGLEALFLLGIILDDLAISFTTIGLLFLIPIFTREILTFHTDILPSVFSLFAFIAGITYHKTKKNYWILCAGFFVGIAIFTKLDISAIPSLLLLFLPNYHKQTNYFISVIKKSLAFLLAICTLGVISALTFGLQSIFKTLQFRLLVSNATVFDPGRFFLFFNQNGLLEILLVCSIFLGIVIFIKKSGNIFFRAGFVWMLTTFLMLFVYHPLQPHHLVLLCIPTALVCTFEINLLWQKYFSQKRLLMVSLIFALVVIGINIYMAIGSIKTIQTAEESKGLETINHYTSPSDYIIADDNLLTGLSKRLPPPNLSDISYVRIASKTVTLADMEKDITKYKPKLIFPWEGRLLSIQGFKELLLTNHYWLLTTVEEGKPVYILRGS